MWNYTLKSAQANQTNGNAEGFFTFTADDGRTKEQPFSTNDPNTLDTEGKQACQKFQNEDDRVTRLKDFLTTPPVGQPMPTDPIPDPTPEQIYQTDLQALKQLIIDKQAMGIDPTQDQDVLDLQQTVQNEFDSTFVVPIDTTTRTIKKRTTPPVGIKSVVN